MNVDLYFVTPPINLSSIYEKDEQKKYKERKMVNFLWIFSIKVYLNDYVDYYMSDLVTACSSCLIVCTMDYIKFKKKNCVQNTCSTNHYFNFNHFGMDSHAFHYFVHTDINLDSELAKPTTQKTSNLCIFAICIHKLMLLE